MPHLYLEMVQAQLVPIKHIQKRRPFINHRMLRHKATTIQIMQIHKPLQTVPIIRRQQIHIIPIIKDRWIRTKRNNPI